MLMEGGGAVGGLYSDVEVSYNLFKENTAQFGGAVIFSFHTMTSMANTYTNNTARDDGGAILGQILAMKSFSDTFSLNTISGERKLANSTAAGVTSVFDSTFAKGKHAGIKLATDIFSSGSEVNPSGSIPAGLGLNIYLFGSVLEFKCKSPIPETTLDESVAFASCI